MHSTSRNSKKLQGWFRWKRLIALFTFVALIGVVVFASGYDSDTSADIYGYYQYVNDADNVYIEFHDDYIESVIGYAPEYIYIHDTYDYESHYEGANSDENEAETYTYDSYEYSYYEYGGYIGIAPTSFIEVTLTGPMFFGATGLQHHIDNLPVGWTLYVRLNFLGGTFNHNVFGPGSAAQPIVIDGGQNVIIDTHISGTNMMWTRIYQIPGHPYVNRHFEVRNGTLEIRNVTLMGARDGYIFQGGVLVDGENSTFIMSHESIHSTQSNTVISSPRIFDTSSEFYGGGVEVRNGGSFIMLAGTIGDLCQARYGGGVSVRGVGSSGQRSSFEMRGGTVHRNQTLRTTDVANRAALLGGGVHVSGGASFVMVDCNDTPSTPRIYHNATDGRGGGVAVMGSHGNQPSTFTMSGGIIGTDLGRQPYGVNPLIWTGNMSLQEGGGIYVGDGARLTMYNGSIYSNTSGLNVTLAGDLAIIPRYSRGGGVCVSGASSRFYMYNGFIGNPHAEARRANGAARGGGVAVNNGARFYFNGGSIWHNVNEVHISGAWHPDDHPHRHGAGVHVDNNSTLTMTGGYISHNASHIRGGGVYVNNNSTFAMSNGAIRNNSAVTEGGGVKLTTGSIFNMSGGTIGGAYTPPALSSAANTAARGGGVAIYDGAAFNMAVPVSGTGGSILGNSASGGGGVAVIGSSGVTTSFIMHSGTIGGNHGTGGVQGAANIISGGGVLVFGTHGIFTMNNGDIRDNRTPMWSGGGVNATNHSSFIMNGGYIQNNTAVISGGGGVSVRYNATFTMNNNSTIRNNASILGSGVLAYNSGLFTMNNGTINSNIVHAASNGDVFGGGGIGVIARGTAYMHGGTIRDHVVNVGAGLGNGGGVWVGMVSGFASGIHQNGINRFTMTGGYIINNEARNGGGVLVEGGDLIIGAPGALTHNHFILTGGHIRGNEARLDGGGLHIRDNGILQMPGGTIGGIAEAHANIAGTNGGGLNLQSSSFTMNGGTIDGNRALPLINPVGANAHMNNVGGGGIFATGSTIELNNNARIINNRTTGSGGGINMDNSNMVIDMNSNGMIDGNETTSLRFSRGGGINIRQDSTVEMIYGRISNNRSWTGAGVRVDGGHTQNTIFIMRDGIIEHNHGLTLADHDVNAGYTPLESNGGGVTVDLATVRMEDGVIRYNTAYFGGGVRVGVGTFTMEYGHIYGNEATDTDGGGIYLMTDDAIFIMHEGSIHDNTAYEDGGGVWVHEEASFTAFDGYITYNTAGRMGGGIFTEHHDYNCPLVLVPPTVTGDDVAYSNLTLQGITFANNTANQLWWPPSNRALLTNLGFITTSQPTNIPNDVRHPLNNYDINFRVSLLRFDFFKTDPGIYQPLDPAINLLADAQFRVFRNTNPELSPPIGTGSDYLISLPLDPVWEEVFFVNNINTSPGAGSTTPLGFYMDPRHTYQLIEVIAPIGFQMPMGQWRITATSGNINNAILIGGYPMPGIIRSTDLPSAVNHPILQRNNLFYIGNWHIFELPMTGSGGITVVVLAGSVLLGLAIVLTFIKIYKRLRT